MPAFTLGNKQAKYMPILNVSDQKYVICFGGGIKDHCLLFQARGWEAHERDVKYFS